MNLYQILGICLAMTTLVVATKFTDCGSKGAEVHSVEIRPCKHEPCVMQLGKPYSMKVTFTPVVNTTSIMGQTFLKMQGKTLVFPPSNLCDAIRCPIVTGEKLSVVAWLNFKPVYPQSDTELDWLAIGEYGMPFFCISVPLKLKEGAKSLESQSIPYDSLDETYAQISKFSPLQTQ